MLLQERRVAIAVMSASEAGMVEHKHHERRAAVLPSRAKLRGQKYLKDAACERSEQDWSPQRCPGNFNRRQTVRRRETRTRARPRAVPMTPSVAYPVALQRAAASASKCA